MDPEGVIVLGCSAGGHLVASLGTLWQGGIGKAQTVPPHRIHMKLRGNSCPVQCADKKQRVFHPLVRNWIESRYVKDDCG